MTTATAQQNAELAERIFDALNERDRDVFAALQADDLIAHDAGEEIRGLDAVTDYQWAFFEAFPDAEFTLEDLVADDEKVAFRYTIAGTHEGEFQGISPTGEAYEITATGLFRVDDGTVSEVWLNYDALGLLEQLGVVEQPGE